MISIGLSTSRRLLWISNQPLEEHRIAELSEADLEVVSLSRNSNLIEKVARIQHGAAVIDGTSTLSSRIELIRKLRGATSAPLLVMGSLGDERDQAILLDVGADDLVDSGVGTRLLISRLRGLIRRGSIEAPKRRQVATFGGLIVDVVGGRARINAFALSFPQAELELLHELALHQGRPVAREDLRARLLRNAEDQNKRTIDQMVHRLRRKLRQQTADAIALNPVRGVGYRFVAAVEDEPIASERDEAALQAGAGFQQRVSGGGRVAILPFHNQTGRADLAWIDLGLMSTTIDALASAPGVSVVSATDLLAVVGSQDSNTPLEVVAQKVASVLGVSDVVQAVVKADPQGGMTLEYVGRGPRLGRLNGAREGYDPIALCRQMAEELRDHIAPQPPPVPEGLGGPPKEVVKDAQFVHVAHSRALHAIHVERWELARRLLRVALDIAPDDIAMRLDYARCLVLQRDLQVAPLLEQALKQARAAHDPALEVRALHLYATHLHGCGKLDEAERLMSSALKIAEAQQDQESELQLLVSIGETLVSEGRTAVAAWVVDRASQLAGALGNRVATARLLDVRGRIAAIKGDDQAAMAAFSEAAALSEHYGIFATASFSAAHVGNCLVNAGQMIAAADCFDRAFRYACQSGSPVSIGMSGYHAVRYGGLRRGDVEHAGGILERMRQASGVHNTLVQGCADFAESFVRARAGRLEESARLLEMAEQKLAASRSFTFHAAKYRARVLLCLGRLDQASDLCEVIRNRAAGRLKRPTIVSVLHLRALVARARRFDAEALNLLRDCMDESLPSIARAEAALDAAWLHLEADELDAARSALSGLEEFMAAALVSEYGAAMLVQARLHFAGRDAGRAAELQRRYCEIMSCPADSDAYRCLAVFEQARVGPTQPLARVKFLPSLFETAPGMG
jgi:DNA-binding response OmpR family regulator/tetratricopeptide (TPR) repeat protein/TolB-like protein